jgi:hypothetical protein
MKPENRMRATKTADAFVVLANGRENICPTLLT